jgi:hypothetical protein
LTPAKAGAVAFSTAGDAELGDYDDEPTIIFKTDSCRHGRRAAPRRGSEPALMGALGAAYILDRSSTHLVGQIMDAAWRFWKGWLTGEPSPARSAAA